MKLHIVFLAAALGLATTAFGATPAPGASTGGGPHGPCAKNPTECLQLASKFDQWCSANAQKCTDLKARVEKRREWCEANKDKCEKMMKRMHEHRHGDKGQNPNGDQDDDGPTPPT